MHNEAGGPRKAHPLEFCFLLWLELESGAQLDLARRSRVIVQQEVSKPCACRILVKDLKEIEVSHPVQTASSTRRSAVVGYHRPGKLDVFDLEDVENVKR